MDSQQNSVNHDEKYEKDSIISERCWEEMYRNDSRRWLTRDGFSPHSLEHISSTMKETYQYPEQDERQFVGIKRATLQQQFLNEVAEEIIKEQNEPPPVEEYCTEYDGNYWIPGYDHRIKPKQNVEMHLKYPLYSSPLASYWQFQYEKNTGGTKSVLGLTPTFDLRNPFRRNSGFTTPMSEKLDDSNL